MVRRKAGAPPGIVEMHNGPGKMMMKGSSLSMIHGNLLGIRHEVNTKLELQKAAEAHNCNHKRKGGTPKQEKTKTGKHKRKKGYE